MSNIHPYWAYAENGSQVSVFEAMAEGRRAFAMELAVEVALDGEPAEVTVAVAREFEEYLKGGTDAPSGE